jgi:hypothetical protein
LAKPLSPNLAGFPPARRGDFSEREGAWPSSGAADDEEEVTFKSEIGDFSFCPLNALVDSPLSRKCNDGPPVLLAQTVPSVFAGRDAAQNERR